MAKKSRKPDLKYLVALRSELESAYSSDDERIDVMRDNRLLRRAIDLDPELRLVSIEVHDSTIADEIQRVAAALSVNPPTMTVVSSRRGDLAQQNATLREHWTEAVLDRASRKEPGAPTYARAIDAIVGDGAAWTKLVFSKDSWEERYAISPDDFEDEHETGEDGEPVVDKDTGLKKIKRSRQRQYDEATELAKKRTSVPFEWINVDVRTVYPVWYGRQIGEVLEVQKRPLNATLREYDLALHPEKGFTKGYAGPPKSETGAQAELIFLEHWTKHYCTYALVTADGKHSHRIRQFPHRYGRHPYFLAMGMAPGFVRGAKCGWSIAETKRHLVEYRAFLLTIHANVAARDALPPIAEEVLDPAAQLMGSDSRPKEAEKWHLRQRMRLAPGTKLTPLQFPNVAQSLREEIALVTDAIDRLSTPRVTSEIGGGLEGAGFAINQVLSESRLRFSPLAAAIEAMLVEVTYFLWRLVREKVGEAVWVQRSGEDAGWLKAGPDELTDDVDVQWHLDPEQPSAKLIEARYWHERVDKKTASRDQAIEAMGDDPDEVRIQIALDELRESPWYKTYLQQSVLAMVGRGDLLRQAKAAEQIALTGVVPGAGQLGPAGDPGMMGNSQVPDMGRLAVSPNGQGAGLVNGSVVGAGPGAVVPAASAAPGVQDLGG